MIIHEFTFLMMKEKSILNMHPKQRTTRKIPVNNNRCHGPEKTVLVTLSIQWKVLV